jgi:hypothetical protein
MAQYEAGQYPEAIESYHAAYELLPLPLLLFDLAQAHRLSGDSAKAIELYQKYLDVEPKGHASAEARQRLAELRRAKAVREPAPVKVAPLILPTIAPEPSPTPVPEVVVVAPVVTPPAAPRKTPKWVWGVVGGVVAAVAVGLGVGLGVGLSGGDHYPSASYGSGVLR